MIEVASLVQMVIVMISISLILGNWRPPVPKGQQGLICFISGGVLGYLFAGFNFDGVMTGLIAASIAFWRKDLFDIFNEVKDETSDMIGGTKNGKI